MNQIRNFRGQPLVITHSLELSASCNKDVNFDFEKQLDIKAKHHQSGQKVSPVDKLQLKFSYTLNDRENKQVILSKPECHANYTTVPKIIEAVAGKINALTLTQVSMKDLFLILHIIHSDQ